MPASGDRRGPLDLPVHGGGGVLAHILLHGTIHALLYEDSAPGAGRSGFLRRLLG